MGADGPEQPVFYYDLGSLDCYLVAEQVTSVLGTVPEWEPVLGADIGWSEPEPNRETAEQRALELGLQPLRWPAQHPVDTRAAMLAATYAKHVGRAVAFSLAAFRQAFAGGRDLGERDNVLIAAAACEMHPRAVLQSAERPSVREELQRTTAQALQAGVTSVPAVCLAGRVFAGEDALRDAALHVSELDGARR
jgi:2-hydroxychromene-2-carboxylate isomerase